MEDETRQRKIAAGREKLAKYKKRKSGDKEKGTDSEQSSLTLSDASLSLSPLPMSETQTTNKPIPPAPVQEAVHSESSSISENIELTNSNSYSNSENDRSLQEIVIGNIPLDSPELSLTSIVNNAQQLPLIEKKSSLQNSLISDCSVISLNALEKFENNNFLDSSHAQNILDEIIKHDSSFDDDGKCESIQSNPFDDLSSITLKSERITGCENKASQSDSKNKFSEEVMANKEPIASQTEIDSLKEVNSSNPSTISTTEYKQYYDKVNLGTIEYQDLLSHRDDHIKQLTDALQQVLEDRNHLQEQTDYFAQEIADLKEQLIQTTAIIKKNKWNVALLNEDKKQHPIKSDESESTSLQSLANELKLNNPKNYANVSEINFDFEDPEFNETMTPEEKKIVADMRNKINTFIQQRVEEHKQMYETEIKELQVRLECEKKLNKPRMSSNKNTEDSVSSLPSSEAKDVPDFTKFEIDDQMFNDTFTQDELQVIAELRSKIFLFIQQNIDNCKIIHEAELKILKDKMESEKVEHDAEISRLRDLLTSVKSGSAQLDDLRHELNTKHNVEMEELRTYFEKLCADIEKHYSEEIISQQSRKMSGSSVSELESEIFPAQMGPAGDVLAINADTKSDINNLRLELQNKYHAELEILREDYENRLDELKISHENNIQSIEKKYDIIIKSLKEDLLEAQKNAVASQEVASSGDFEIAEVVQSYERRLQEQVMLAKIDIVSALEQQIQTLVSSPSDNLEWPPELLQLRDRLTEHWHSEIKDIKEQHAKEVTQLKEDHERNLTRALERERRNSLKNGEEIEIKKERDALKKISSNLRHLVAELIKYFTKCEDELNNTLVEELLKYGFDKEISKIESDFNDSSHSESELLDGSSAATRVKRVHFTPDVSGIIDIINETNFDLDASKDISNEFRTELDLCLSRLKTEANAILSLSSNLKPKVIEIDEANKIATNDDKICSLTRQLITETQMKNELNIQLEEARGYVQSLEAEKQSLENQLEQMVAKQQVLNMELNSAKEKINDLVENGRKEIISEGYGESQIMGTCTLGERTISFSELQEKARMLLAEVEGTSHNPLHKLVDDLCREGDRLMEDAKTDHDDLIQQIEAADKKLRCTTQFLEEQAVERELERDDAQKEIAALREQLREVERTRVSCEQINTEESQIKKLPACRSDFHTTVLETVERLETQMRDMTLVMNECETKKLETENELKEAIDKIWVLRDIIRDLETQIEEKTKTETDLKNIVTQLEDKISFETKHNEELIQKVQTLNNAPGDQYQEIIRKLESENQKLKVSSELIGPDGVLKQVKTQLNEIEKTLEKRTKDLESLHAVNTNCSSPSEDMSIRDQIRPLSSNDDNSDLPLEQLARLKDKLIRHARAEDAAMKRIRDLEMQLFTSKHDYEEMQSERDVLQEQLSEQLVLISSLQLRLDEQRLRVESAQKQSNTSFDRKIYELENEIQSLKEIIHIRDNNNKQLSVVVEQTKKRIAEQEKQLNNAVDIEKQIVDQFEAEIGRLKTENEELKKKLQQEYDNSATQNFLNETLRSKTQSPETFAPDTLDSLLAEKNADIDRLKSKLNEYKEEFKFYSSLNFSKDQLLQLSSIHKPNNESNHQMTSLVDVSEPDVHRRQPHQHEHSFESMTSASNNLEFKRNANETVFIGSTFRDSKYADKVHHSPFTASEISSIEKIPQHLNETPSKIHKHVHFDEHEHSELSNLESKLTELQHEIERQNNTIKTYEIDIDKLRRKLQFSDDTIRDKTEEFTEQIDTLNEAIKNGRVEMAHLKVELEQKEKKLEHLEKDVERKDKMFMNLVQEKRDLETKYKELEKRYAEFDNYEKMMEHKNKEIFQLEQQLAEKTPSASTESLHESILLKEKEIEHLSKTVTKLETHIGELKQECDNLNKKLNETEKHLENKNNLLQKNDKDYQNILSQFNELTNHIEELKVTLDDKCKKIAEMERDLEREKELRDTIAKYQKEIVQLRSTIEENEKKAKENNVKEKDVKSMNYEVEQKVLTNQLELEKKELEILNQKALIDNLNKEIHHLQDYLNEKDKIIQQMTSDSNSLHSALEAIQSKIQESGNVVDLKKRLREEQNLTTALHDELKYLKQSIEQFENVESTDAMETLVILKENVDKEKLNNLELKTSNHSLQQEVKALKEKFSAAEKTIEKLTQLLADEKLNSNTIQVQDANIIESMRVRLEALLDHENDTEKQLRKEQEKRKELEQKLCIDPMDTELTTLKLNQAQLAAENDILKSELDTIKTLNQMINTELQNSKALIENQQTELKSLKYAVECLSQIKYDTKKHQQQTEERNVELFSKIEDENQYLKQKIDEMSKSVMNLREKEKELCQLLAIETNRQLDSVVPDKFLRKIRDINMLLQSHIADNKQLTNSLAVLTEENKLLHARLKDLEKPAQLKSPFDDPVARADHLFGRYLKSESYRKALIFQKRYLLTLLASYQRGSSLNTAVLQVILPKSTHPRGIHRFRVVVYAVMSIRRMQYIVQRWHTGKRIGASIVTKRPYVMNRPFTAQPSLNYVTANTNAQKPNRGNSPPSRDLNFHKNQHLGDTIQESIILAPLQAPALLSNYIERFDTIQQKLGLAIQKSST